MAFLNDPFLFSDGKEIQVEGEFVDCVPTTFLDVCYGGFKDSHGRYFLIANLQEIMESNPELRFALGENRDLGQFRITGIFNHGSPIGYDAADVTGTIKVTSMISLENNTQFTVSS